MISVKLVICWLCLLGGYYGQNLSSPCPKIFQYQFDDEAIFGQIKLPAPFAKQNVIILHVVVQLPSAYVESSEYKSEQVSLDVQSSKPVLYRVRFPADTPIPQLRSITINGLEVCTGSPEFGSDVTVTSIELNHSLNRSDQTTTSPTTGKTTAPITAATETTEKIAPRIAAQPTTSVSSESEANLLDECGKKSTTVGNRQYWPWMVTMYVANGDGNFNLNCGGTLVSNNKILTSANCLYNFRQRRFYETDEVFVVLGVFNVTRSVGQHAPVRKVVAHPDYTPNDGKSDADIAVLVLKEPVKFTSWIRPVCLWSESSDVQTIEGANGTVVNWARLPTGPILLGRTEVYVVSQTNCTNNHETLSPLVTNRTICAGNFDLCNGDSGGGLAILRNDRWTLRGLVSRYVGNIIGRCDAKHYVVYTDVAKFTDWVKQIV